MKNLLLPVVLVLIAGGANADEETRKTATTLGVEIGKRFDEEGFSEAVRRHALGR